MPIAIKHEKPTTYQLGGASFHSDDDRTGDRLISVRAENSLHMRRPIDLSVAGADHRTIIGLSEDEAEALIACLTHAVALRRQADNAAAVSASRPFP